jgi:hypothetical protein
MQLHAVVTDLAGNGLARLGDYTDLEAVDPLNDSRTARLKVSLYDPAVALLKPLARGLKIVYGNALIFNGIQVSLSFDYAAGNVEIIAHDPTIKLKQHFHRYGDIVVDHGYPIDGIGMRRLIESSIPNEPQLDSDIPGNHILWGHDDTYRQAPKGEDNTEPPFTGDPSQWRRITRGDNVWDTLRNVQQTLNGPDFRFRPVDADHPGVQGIPTPGFMVEFDTYTKLETDRTEQVVFQHNFGTDNAENVVHEPDGSSTRNYMVVVYPGGERAPTDDAHRALAHNGASWLEIGIYQGWESSTQQDTAEILLAKAEAYVRAYAVPPNFFTVTPRIDAANVPQYARDYFVGDLIRAQARKGYREVDLLGRILSATVRQEDSAGNTRVELECVPPIDPDLDEGGD